MSNQSTVNEQLNGLASYLATRRDQILTAWRKAVDADPEMTTASTVTRNQFNDHIPEVLDAFERRLRAEDAIDKANAIADEKAHAAEHGLHRWQQGYDLPETTAEWGHLHICLLDEIEQYSAAANLNLSANGFAKAHRALVRLCSDGVRASVARYATLQQAEAATRVRDLEAALQQLTLLDKQRTETWREAAHDLRGSAHVISNVSAALALSKEGLTESKQSQFSDILRRGVSSLNILLADLMDHARLEAGQEHRTLIDFDVAAMLKEFCESMRPAAGEKNLFLKCEGPGPLYVQGDSVKIRRIAQNLVLNALKATEHGGVKVLWETGGSELRPQWMLCVQDTGPGFKGQLASPLEKVLQQATTESHVVEDNAQANGSTSVHTDPAPTLVSQTAYHIGQLPSGEGIGLSIVKRLCELLDASLELETAEGSGTTFRVIFPSKYA